MLDAELQLLKSPDEDIRCAAVARLAEGNVNQILEPLMSTLSDPSWRVRKVAVKALGKADKVRLVPLLIQALKEDNVGTRNSAIECLINIGKYAVSPLCQTLSDPDKDLRIFVVNTLGAIGDRTAYPYLAKALMDPEKNVCYAAIEALGKVKDPRAVVPLIQIVQGGDIWLKIPAISALGELADSRATPYLLPLAQDFLLKETVIETLGAIGDETSVPCIVQALEDQDPEIQQAALFALKKVVSKADRINQMIGERTSLRGPLNQVCTGEALRYIIQASEDENTEIAEVATFLLGWIDSPQAIETLIKLLSYERLSDMAVESLLHSGAQALATLLASYEFSDYTQKLRILGCLTRLGWDLLSEPGDSSDAETRALQENSVLANRANQESLFQMLKVFTGCLKDEEEEIQMAALRALASEKFVKFLKLEALRAYPFFEEILASAKQVLQSSNSFLRAEAIKLIGQLEEITALDLLYQSSKDLDGRVRAAAVAQIGCLALRDLNLLDSVILALSDDDPKVREQAALALGAIPQPKAFDALTQASQDEDIRVKRTVIHALGRFQNSQVIETLEQVLSRSKRREEGTVRVAISEALGHFINSEKSVALLIEMLADYDFVVRRAVASTLGYAKNHRHRVKDSLLKALEDAHWSVREAAVRSLGVLGFKECEDLFIDLLSHSEISLRKGAIGALGEVNSEKAMELLINLLADESLNREAYQALLMLADSYKPLIEKKGLLYQNPLIRRLVKSILDRSGRS